MSGGVLVVEGVQYSGSSNTAKMAIQRKVFTAPGNITSKVSWGPNLLIMQDAKLVQEGTDVTVEVELPGETCRVLIAKAQPRMAAMSLKMKDQPAVLPAELSAVSRAMLAKILPDAPIRLDELLESFDTLTSSETIAALFELELLGLVRQLPGKNFVRVW
jgi:DNA processing protein